MGERGQVQVQEPEPEPDVEALAERVAVEGGRWTKVDGEVSQPVEAE